MATCTVSDYWSLFKKQGGRSFSLLAYHTHSVSPAVLCSPGLNSPPLHKGHSWSMMLWDHVGPSCAAAHSHQSRMLWAKVPGSPQSLIAMYLLHLPILSQGVSSNQDLHLLLSSPSLFPLLSLENISFCLHLFSPEVRSLMSKDLGAEPQYVITLPTGGSFSCPNKFKTILKLKLPRSFQEEA